MSENKDITPIDEAEFKRRRRGRSWAIAGLLVALVALFYVVTIIQLSSGMKAG